MQQLEYAINILQLLVACTQKVYGHVRFCDAGYETIAMLLQQLQSTQQTTRQLLTAQYYATVA